ncbi:MAG: cobalamin biosynthesis protein, partial [Clostridia bacterium]|nr:cobalamin biosynthesis protein [Clostridia bacterium]
MEGERLAILAITRHGARLAGELARRLPGSHLYVSEKFAAEAGPGAIPMARSVREQLQVCFTRYDGLVCFISLGAVVRMLAGVLQDKHTDPGVVVVDDRARFAVAVLSGHLGGANDLARRVAALLGATPVITTASDVGGTIAVDLLGREFGWVLEGEANVTPVSAAVVNEEPVAIVQETGEEAWWPADRPLPANIHRYPDLDAAAAAVAAGRATAALLITDRLLDPGRYGHLLQRAVLYRPRSLVLGVGCRRGTAAAEVEELIVNTLAEAGLALASVRNLATAAVKADEPALREIAERRGWPLVTYDAEVLDAAWQRFVGLDGSLQASEAAARHVGTRGVAEPAALLSAGADRLLVPKRKTARATVAVA